MKNINNFLFLFTSLLAIPQGYAADLGPNVELGIGIVSGPSSAVLFGYGQDQDAKAEMERLSTKNKMEEIRNNATRPFREEQFSTNSMPQLKEGRELESELTKLEDKLNTAKNGKLTSEFSTYETKPRGLWNAQSSHTISKPVFIAPQGVTGGVEGPMGEAIHNTSSWTVSGSDIMDVKNSNNRVKVRAEVRYIPEAEWIDIAKTEARINELKERLSKLNYTKIDSAARLQSARSHQVQNFVNGRGALNADLSAAEVDAMKKAILDLNTVEKIGQRSASVLSTRAFLLKSAGLVGGAFSVYEIYQGVSHAIDAEMEKRAN